MKMQNADPNARETPRVRMLIARLVGAPLPVSLRNEFTQELGKYFLPFLIGGAVAAALSMAVAAHVGSSLALALSVIALNGFLLIALACWSARQPLEPHQFELVESRYSLGIFLASAGLGGMVFTVHVAGAPFVLESLLVMVALAALGVGNGSGPGRPVATTVQAVSLGLPTSLATLLYWPKPWNFASFFGIVVYGVACVALALRSYSTQAALLMAREQQRSQRLRINTALQHLNQPMVLLNEQLEIVLINQSARDLLGLGKEDEALMPTFPEVLSVAPNLAKATSNREEFLTHAAMLVTARQQFSGVLRLNNDRTMDIDCIPVPDAGWVAMLRDTTGERNAIAELSRELRRCPLTGLPNRRGFFEELERRLGRETRLALLLIDLDGFKLVNERYGYSVGDRMITRIGFRLRAADPRLVVARLANDQFAVLLPGGGHDEAVALAHSLLEVIDTPARFGDAEVNVGAAIGVALAPDHAMLAGPLHRAADLALLAAKAEPGNQVVLYNATMAEASAKSAAFEATVRAAIRAQQIEVAYQPMVEVQSGRVVAVEALARMPSSLVEATDRDVGPEAMIAIAESRGLIGQLRRQVIRQAAVTVADLPQEVGLWVNISVNDLRSDAVVDEIQADMALAGLEQSRLALEITESALMTDEAATLMNLQRLMAMGSGVAMDDFGSGFSSLERLTRLPINAVKISGRLLTGVEEQDVAANIFRTAVKLGQSLGVLLVAEGVERPTDLALAQAAGVSRVQGYLLSPPVPADQLENAILAAEAAWQCYSRDVGPVTALPPKPLQTRAL